MAPSSTSSSPVQQRRFSATGHKMAMTGNHRRGNQPPSKRPLKTLAIVVLRLLASLVAMRGFRTESLSPREHPRVAVSRWCRYSVGKSHTGRLSYCTDGVTEEIFHTRCLEMIRRIECTKESTASSAGLHVSFTLRWIPFMNHVFDKFHPAVDLIFFRSFSKCNLVPR